VPSDFIHMSATAVRTQCAAAQRTCLIVAAGRGSRSSGTGRLCSRIWPLHTPRRKRRAPVRRQPSLLPTPSRGTDAAVGGGRRLDRDTSVAVGAHAPRLCRFLRSVGAVCGTNRRPGTLLASASPCVAERLTSSPSWTVFVHWLRWRCGWVVWRPVRCSPITYPVLTHNPTPSRRWVPPDVSARYGAPHAAGAAAAAPGGAVSAVHSKRCCVGRDPGPRDGPDRAQHGWQVDAPTPGTRAVTAA
jgi:hypothetical protein